MKENKKFHIEVDGDQRFPVEIETETFQKSERIQRAAKIFFAFIAASVFSVFVPILHFILVPGLFIAAFVMGFLKHSEYANVCLEKFPCPECKNSFQETRIALRKTSKPIKTYCYHCRKMTEFTALG